MEKQHGINCCEFSCSDLSKKKRMDLSRQDSKLWSRWKSIVRCLFRGSIMYEGSLEKLIESQNLIQDQWIIHPWMHAVHRQSQSHHFATELVAYQSQWSLFLYRIPLDEQWCWLSVFSHPNTAVAQRQALKLFERFDVFSHQIFWLHG